MWSILPPKSPQKPWAMGLDGKWLKREVIVFVARNSTMKETLWWHTVIHESNKELVPALNDLYRTLDKNHYSLPMGVVSDWKQGIVSATGQTFGEIPHQRCVAHVDRTLKSLLPARSPFRATRELRRLAIMLEQMTSFFDFVMYQLNLSDWESIYGWMVEVKTKGVMTKKKWWYTHGDLRRAWRLMTVKSDNQFLFLNNQDLPKTNNSLEGLFSQAKSKLSLHRGWQVSQQEAFLYWYFAFQRIKNQSEMRKLWVSWKSRL